MNFVANTNYREGGYLSYQNAKTLLDASRDAANKKNLGLATSLAILSSEEAIKSFLCFQKYHYPEIEIPDFKKIFEKHGVKYNHIIFMLQSMKLGMIEMKDNVTWVRRIMFKFIKSVNSEVSDRDQIAINTMVSAVEKANREPFPFSDTQLINWHARANDSKNNGLYVGLKSNSWLNPSDSDFGFLDECIQIAQAIIDLSGAMDALANILELAKSSRKEDHNGLEFK